MSPVPVLAMNALQKLDDGRLVMEAPTDTQSGATSIKKETNSRCSSLSERGGSIASDVRRNGTDSETSGSAGGLPQTRIRKYDKWNLGGDGKGQSPSAQPKPAEI